ncbi:putative 4-hyroxy-2-oxovalerate/4-hydroxy-2-oxopentanoic acid aldolase [Mycobacterium kansasii]|uniref:Putative 4-hyroxy-2-oxovalerate/4-hydroxy-2-oxopentanoic acid aldolase n=1 Tax=Mycobacterium kansasii TaxID=1768 RepID=A0A1V3X8G7_MYCKA|nr:putative 4-hyroxy-2-oxovalerate/4-hydroxy-2-oxopentanoic acid aldolase [Mycobacterium kansasii]
MRRFGAGAGNAPVEALIGVFDKIGVKTGIDFFDIADAAEDVVRPAMPAECLLDRNALIMGYSGSIRVSSSTPFASPSATACRRRRCSTEPVSAS